MVEFLFSSTSCCTCSSLSGIICLIGFDWAGIFELYVVRYFYCSGCCSALRTKQDHTVMVGEISRCVPPEPNIHLPPQQVLAVAIGNCPNIKVQNKHVQTFKIMSCGPISFSEWVGVWVIRLQTICEAQGTYFQGPQLRHTILLHLNN